MDGRICNDDRTSPVKEARLLLELAIPTIIVQLGVTLPGFLTASYVGREFGSVYLDGYTLANLMGNLSTLSMISGLYSASDTLSPQAFGAGNFRQLGLIAIRAFVGSLALLIPINVFVLLFLERILLAAGQDREASRCALQFYQIYVLSLPLYSLYMVTWKFLSAQSVMWPLLVSTTVGCLMVLPVALEFFTSFLGFRGSALALFAQQFSQCVILLFLLWYKKPHRKGTWPGLSAYQEALEWQAFRRFMFLGLGGMMASLEWVYWEALALIVGTLGVVPLSVHAIPTQVILVTFMLPLGIGIALAVRMGNTLSQSVSRAKSLAFWSLVINAFVFALVSWAMYVYREKIFAVFTKDAEVLAGSEAIWGKVCFYNLFLGMFAAVLGVATGLGMQWTLGIVTLFFLWVFGLPASYYEAIVRNGGIEAAWSWIWPPYLGINCTMGIAFILKDWDELAAEICLREAAHDNELDLESSSLGASCDCDGYGTIG